MADLVEFDSEVLAGAPQVRLSRRALMDLVDGADPPEPEWDMTGEGTAIELFTSGATGEPKAAVLRESWP